MRAGSRLAVFAAGIPVRIEEKETLRELRGIGPVDFRAESFELCGYCGDRGVFAGGMCGLW